MDKTYIAGRAARLLLSQRRHALKIDPGGLLFDRPLTIDTMQSWCEKTAMTMDMLQKGSGSRDGFTLKQKQSRGHIVILYHQALSWERRAFTIAHELGHVYLEHPNDSRIYEAEADFFASSLLLPRALLWELRRRYAGSPSPRELCAIFLASREAAEIALRLLPESPAFDEAEHELLRRLGGLLPSPGEPLLT